LNGVLTASHSLALPLFRAAFSERAPTGKIVGVLAHEIDVRMMVQQSAFTIHDTATPLEELPGAADFLIKFEVAASAKEEMRRQLREIGIRQSTLFPDLGSLARELVDEM